MSFHMRRYLFVLLHISISWLVDVWLKDHQTATDVSKEFTPSPVMDDV